MRLWTEEEQAKYLEEHAAKPAAIGTVPTAAVAVAVPAVSHEAAQKYLRALFVEGDIVCIWLIHATETYIGKDGKPHAKTQSFFQPLEQVADDESMRQLQNFNDEGWHIYVCMNPFKAQEGKARRTKIMVENVRAAYLDIDKNGDAQRQDILMDGTMGVLPMPHFILNSSPHKYQIVWLTQNMLTNEQEALNKVLQRKYEADPQATDVVRVLRIPTFKNLKYGEGPIVGIELVSADPRYTLGDFGVDISDTIRKSLPMGEALTDEKIVKRQEVIEAAMEAAGIDYTEIQDTGKEDWKWQWTIICPNAGQHQTAGDTAAVGLAVDGKIGFSCFHAHCAGRDWTSYLRPLLEQKVGHKLVFEDTGVMIGEKLIERPVEKIVDEGNSISDTCYVFESDEDATIAMGLGLKPATLAVGALELRDTNRRVLIFGKTKQSNSLRSAIGAGAQLVDLPRDKKHSVEGEQPLCTSLAAAAAQYDEKELKQYFETVLGTEKVQELDTRGWEERSSAAPVRKVLKASALQEEYDVELLPSPALSVPHDDDIFYGPAGDVIRKMEPFNESHPVGMYINLLISVGNIMGRGAYFNVDDTQHFTNEFGIFVGESSRGRKGTGRDKVANFTRNIDNKWQASGGFATAQGVIDEIRDDAVGSRKDKNNVYRDYVVPGRPDKRLLVYEGEISRILRLAAKNEGGFSELIRDGWDGKELRNKVAGKTDSGESRSMRCREPHLSISGDITAYELRGTLPVGSPYTGFANRFLFVLVHRTKKVPSNGPAVDYSRDIVHFQKVVAAARAKRHMSMTGAMKKAWNRWYTNDDEQAPLSGV